MVIERLPYNASPQQINAYLLRLADTLNLALNDLEVQGERTKRELTVEASTGNQGLRELISNTASIIRRETAVIGETVRLLDESTASRFGSVDTQISTVESSVAGLSGRTDTLERNTVNAETFTAYRENIEGFIRQGFIAEESGGYIYGIAIGANLEVTETEGKTVFTKDNLAFYTADGIRFFVNGYEQAYFTNGKMLVNNADIKQSMTIGGFIVQSNSYGISFKWAGDNA